MVCWYCVGFGCIEVNLWVLMRCWEIEYEWGLY